jgi:sugar lactone lactonase YvrE
MPALSAPNARRLGRRSRIGHHGRGGLRAPIPVLLWPLLTLDFGGCTQPHGPTGTETILVIDQDAGVDHRGAVFALDPETRQARILVQSELFRRPQDLMQEADGSFLVLDYYDELGTGKIFRVSRDGARVTEVLLPPGLVDPYQFERAPDGSIWIVDKNADPLGLGKQAGRQTGTLWRLTRDLKTLEILATGPPLMAPSGIVFAAGEAFLMDADAFKVLPYRFENDEGGIFRVRRHPQPLETLVRFKGLVSPLGMHRLADGRYLIVDVNADREQPKRIWGAVYRVDPKTGATELFARHPEFRDPANCLVWRDELLVVDANADPLQLGDDGYTAHYGGRGRGGIYRVDLQTGKTELFTADPAFVSPIRLRLARL